VTGGGAVESWAEATGAEQTMLEKPTEKIHRRNERGTELLHGDMLGAFTKTDLLQAFMVNLPV
jgi:hypothetical protein